VFGNCIFKEVSESTLVIMSEQTINLAVNEFYSSKMLLFLHLQYSHESETQWKRDDLKDKFGALPICDLPVSMWSTVLQIAEVAGSIV
jgi:hypothetical protein